MENTSDLSDFENLPSEMTSKILDQLSLTSLRALMQTNKFFYNFVSRHIQENLANPEKNKELFNSIEWVFFMFEFYPDKLQFYNLNLVFDNKQKWGDFIAFIQKNSNFLRALRNVPSLSFDLPSVDCIKGVNDYFANITPEFQKCNLKNLSFNSQSFYCDNPWRSPHSINILPRAILDNLQELRAIRISNNGKLVIHPILQIKARTPANIWLPKAQHDHFELSQQLQLAGIPIKNNTLECDIDLYNTMPQSIFHSLVRTSRQPFQLIALKMVPPPTPNTYHISGRPITTGPALTSNDINKLVKVYIGTLEDINRLRENSHPYTMQVILPTDKNAVDFNEALKKQLLLHPRSQELQTNLTFKTTVFQPLSTTLNFVAKNDERIKSYHDQTIRHRIEAMPPRRVPTRQAPTIDMQWESRYQEIINSKPNDDSEADKIGQPSSASNSRSNSPG